MFAWMANDRPEVQCTFEVMAACDRHFEQNDHKSDCREGARDAHLHPQHVKPFQSAQYEAGRVTTVSNCTEYVPVILH